MTLVRLIMTGKAEFQGMGVFLAKVFPNVTFEMELVDSFTSARIQEIPRPGSAPLLIDKFVDGVIAAIDPGRKKPGGRVPDYVVSIDDLELLNLDQPNVVTNAVRETIRRRVRAKWPSLERQSRCFELLRERASFHFLCPMLESYFYTCPSSLEAMDLQLQPDLVPGQDVEDFETRDPSYLLRFNALPATGADQVLRPQTSTWFAKHPKEYLKYLIGGGLAATRIYRETEQGAAALRALIPANALAIANHCRFLRSLIHDLADALNVSPTVELVGESHPETGVYSRPNRLLRNI
ncbi:MAG: hypothetical protein JSS49_12255 [Planctomycetes bacterium]|nr:hypothetical protein [Planctomycetota bacterium]